MTRTNPDILTAIAAFDTPIWARGQVSGHGLYYTTRFDDPVTVGDLAVSPGDLLAADADGVVKIPGSIDPTDVLAELRASRRREDALLRQFAKPGATLASIRHYFSQGFWEAGEAQGDVQ